MELEVKVLDINKKEFIKKIKSLGATLKKETKQFLYTYDLPTIYGRFIDIKTQLKDHESNIKYETAIEKLKLLFFELDNLLTEKNKKELKEIMDCDNLSSICQRKNILEILDNKKVMKFIEQFHNNSKKWIRVRQTNDKTTIAIKHILADNGTGIQQMLETEMEVPSIKEANGVLEALGYSYKSYEEKEVLKDINISFDSGKIYGLLGRNGSGKTTFFNCINEDIPKNSGEVYLDNELIQGKDIGYVISTPIVPEFLTGREFIQFYLDINPTSNKMTIDEYFDLVKINKDERDKLLRDYSHGTKSKIQILANLIANPKVLLLDEPLTSLDIVIQEEMKELLKELKKDHIIIFSTHILELALDLCDDIVVITNHNLESIQKKNLSDKKYKDRILNLLREEKDD